MSEENINHYTIISIGDQYVGKSSILSRFFQDKFYEDYQATIGLDFQSKKINIEDFTFNLHLYDTSGQEKFRALIPMYIRKGDIFMIIYDISNKDSFIHLECWINEINLYKKEDVICLLVGNKIDLEDKRQVLKEEAEKYAKTKGFLFQEVSCKTGDKIRELFEKKIFPEILKKEKKRKKEENKEEKEKENVEKTEKIEKIEKEEKEKEDNSEDNEENESDIKK